MTNSEMIELADFDGRGVAGTSVRYHELDQMYMYMTSEEKKKYFIIFRLKITYKVPNEQILEMTYAEQLTYIHLFGREDK